jgi:hypothetical protein
MMLRGLLISSNHLLYRCLTILIIPVILISLSFLLLFSFLHPILPSSSQFHFLILPFPLNFVFLSPLNFFPPLSIIPPQSSLIPNFSLSILHFLLFTSSMTTLYSSLPILSTKTIHPNCLVPQTYLLFASLTLLLS